MYNKYRIIKRKNITVPDSFTYVIQVEGYGNGGFVGAQAFGGFQHQGAVWTDVSYHSTLEAARIVRKQYETGLKAGDEIVE